jgi:hypothetical protein
MGTSSSIVTRYPLNPTPHNLTRLSQIAKVDGQWSLSLGRYGQS